MNLTSLLCPVLTWKLEPLGHLSRVRPGGPSHPGGCIRVCLAPRGPAGFLPGLWRGQRLLWAFTGGGGRRGALHAAEVVEAGTKTKRLMLHSWKDVKQKSDDRVKRSKKDRSGGHFWETGSIFSRAGKSFYVNAYVCVCTRTHGQKWGRTGHLLFRLNLKGIPMMTALWQENSLVAAGYKCLHPT